MAGKRSLWRPLKVSRIALFHGIHSILLKNDLNKKKLILLTCLQVEILLLSCNLTILQIHLSVNLHIFYQCTVGNFAFFWTCSSKT